MSLTDSEYTALEAAVHGISLDAVDEETAELLWHLEKKDMCDRSYAEHAKVTYTTNAHGRAVLRQHAEELEQQHREKAADERAKKSDRKYQIVVSFLGALFGAVIGLLVQILYTWISQH